MKAHIARNQYTGVPTLLTWALSTGDRGKLDGIADAFRMRVVAVQPEDVGCTVGQLLGEPGRNPAPAKLPAATPAILMANFTEEQVDALLDLFRQMEVVAPLKALSTPHNLRWSYAYLLEHLAEEHAAYQAAARARQ